MTTSEKLQTALNGKQKLVDTANELSGRNLDINAKWDDLDSAFRNVGGGSTLKVSYTDEVLLNDASSLAIDNKTFIYNGYLYDITKSLKVNLETQVSEAWTDITTTNISLIEKNNPQLLIIGDYLYITLSNDLNGYLYKYDLTNGGEPLKLTGALNGGLSGYSHGCYLTYYNNNIYIFNGALHKYDIANNAVETLHDYNIKCNDQPYQFIDIRDNKLYFKPYNNTTNDPFNWSWGAFVIDLSDLSITRNHEWDYYVDFNANVKDVKENALKNTIRPFRDILFGISSGYPYYWNLDENGKLKEIGFIKNNYQSNKGVIVRDINDIYILLADTNNLLHKISIIV